MKLVVGIPALGQNETLQKNIDLLIANADNKPTIVVWDNAPHHMYDHDVCMESIDKGYTNWTLNIDHDHQGGVSVCRENWTRDFQYTGDEIHDLASIEFYNKWKHKLPMKHESIISYY